MRRRGKKCNRVEIRQIKKGDDEVDYEENDKRILNLPHKVDGE